MDLQHPSPDLAPTPAAKTPSVAEMRARILNKLQYQIGKSPSRASPSAVARPRPEVAPVTAAVRPFSEPGVGSAGHPGSRRRTASPVRAKPGATVRSIAVSTPRANDPEKDPEKDPENDREWGLIRPT